MRFLYIHGFASSGESHKARALKTGLAPDEVMTPTLSYVPSLAFQTLRQLVDESLAQKEELTLIGASLGGYYATHLSWLYNLKAILINPAIAPYETLKLAIGEMINYSTKERFLWTHAHLEELKTLYTPHPDESKLLLLLQKGDELLNYLDALKRFPRAKNIIEEGGNHQFQGIERHIEMILRFAKGEDA